jgi:hypothetical protein
MEIGSAHLNSVARQYEEAAQPIGQFPPQCARLSENADHATSLDAACHFPTDPHGFAAAHDFAALSPLSRRRAPKRGQGAFLLLGCTPELLPRSLFSPPPSLLCAPRHRQLPPTSAYLKPLPDADVLCKPLHRPE